MSAAADWEWEDYGDDDRTSLIASFIRGSSVVGPVDVLELDELDELEEDGWDGVSRKLPDDAPEGGFGGGDRRSISVSPAVEQYHGDDWMVKVNCKDLGPLFYSGFPADVTMALELCRKCEVLEECRDDALGRGDLYYGVVGGMTPSARRRAVNEHRRKP